MSPKLSRILMAIAALLLAEATVLGALASHVLGSKLDPETLRSFETAVDYEFFQSLGLMGVAIYGARIGPSNLLSGAALFLLAGIALFCGGIYFPSLGGPAWILHLAPVGGIALIVGWLAVAVAVFRGRVPD